MPHTSLFQVQCNYCDYSTTADEYGVHDAPLHLKSVHEIDAPNDYSSHFHHMLIRSSPYECIWDSIRKAGVALDDVSQIAEQVYNDLKEEGYMFYFTPEDEPEEF